MPFLTTFRRATPVTGLFILFTAAQTCWYPDGQTVSTDVVCNTTSAASSCCPSDSFCMDNGLCYSDGLVSRSSCTDQTWGSEACAGYCKTESPSTAISITPCSSALFVCGLNNTECQTDSSTFVMSGGSGFVLRPSQIAALVEPALAAATPTSTATSCPTQAAVSNTTGLFTAGEMAGVGCGVGLPLFLALCAALILLRNERKKHAKPKLMYKLPDSCKDEFTFRPPPSAGHDRAPYSPTSTTTRVPSMAPSRRASLKTMGSQKPAHVLSFMERYESMKKKMQVHEMDLGQPTRHEMDSEPPYKEISRHELGDGRVSLD